MATFPLAVIRIERKRRVNNFITFDCDKGDVLFFLFQTVVETFLPFISLPLDLASTSHLGSSHPHIPVPALHLPTKNF